jgi:hypothetical protein
MLVTSFIRELTAAC